MKYLTLNTIFLLLLFFVTAWGYQAEAQTGKTIVIVNVANPVGELNASQVKLYYMRKLKRLWPETNKPIKPVDRKGDVKIKKDFYAHVLGMPAAEVSNYFKQRQFANSETPPAEFQNDAEVVDFVMNNDGAIGYISGESYQAVKGKVKAIFVF